MSASSMIRELPGFVQIIAVVALVSGISVIILNEFMLSGTYSADVNTTLTEGIAGLSEVTEWLELIALIIAATIILALVFKAIGESGRSGGGY